MCVKTSLILLGGGRGCSQSVPGPWVPRLPRSMEPGRLEDGEGSELWRPCHSAGGVRWHLQLPRLPAALTQLRALIALWPFRAPGSQIGDGNLGITLAGTRTLTFHLTVEGFAHIEDPKGFQNVWSFSLAASPRLGICPR